MRITSLKAEKNLVGRRTKVSTESALNFLRIGGRIQMGKHESKKAEKKEEKKKMEKKK